MEVWHHLHKGFGARQRFLLSVAFYFLLHSLISIYTSGLCAFNILPNASVSHLKRTLQGLFKHYFVIVHETLLMENSISIPF